MGDIDWTSLIGFTIGAAIIIGGIVLFILAILVPLNIYRIEQRASRMVWLMERHLKAQEQSAKDFKAAYDELVLIRKVNVSTRDLILNGQQAPEPMPPA